jgi:murein DD-endopeptidase MepM/ murein hydrolase activator NlpD
MLPLLGGCALTIPEPPPPVTVEAASIGHTTLSPMARSAVPAIPHRSLRAPPLPITGPRITWSPNRPSQGNALAIRVREAPGFREAEPLHLELAGRDVSLTRTEGGWIGLVALPIDSAGPLELVARYGDGERAFHDERVVLARERRYAATRLRVAPRGEDRPEVQARIREDQTRIRATLRATSPEWLPRESFEWPRPPEFTSPFGQRRVFNGVTRSRHLGLDLRGSSGTPVRAPAAGRVTLVGDFFYQGNAVYLDHGLGLVTAYFHLSVLDVAEGDAVEPGQLLGRVGSTGRSTAPHLHWSAYVNGLNVDPASLIGLEFGVEPDGSAARAASDGR